MLKFKFAKHLNSTFAIARFEKETGKNVIKFKFAKH